MTESRRSQVAGRRSPRGDRVLGSLRLRLNGLIGLKVLLVLAGTLGLAALALVVTDVVVILPEGARALAWVWPALAGLVVVAVGAFALARTTDVRVARRFEMYRADLGTALTNAVQLAGAAASVDTSEVLRRQAVIYGRERAHGLSPWTLAKRGTAAAAVVVVVAGALWLVGLTRFADVFDAVIPRFTDPHGDHPPWSRLKIEVDPENAEVLYGASCEIHARASGASVEKMYLVAENASGSARTVMFLRPDKSYTQALTNLRERTRFYVTDGRARSHYHTIDIRLTPEIELVELETTFPEYTGMRSHRRKLEKTELEMPKRTVLDFRITSNRPLSAGTLELTPILGGGKRTVTLGPETDGAYVVHGGFEVTEPVAFAITVTDVDGLVSGDSRKGRVMILPDRRPTITVMQPGRHALATPDISIPVDVRSRDDYGVKQVVWFRGHNRSIERGFTMKEVTQKGAREVDAKGAFNLADLGVKPGDEIEYFFEAVDTNPDGPNVTTSRLYRLRIISNEQYEQILRQAAAQRALFERYLQLSDQMRRLRERAGMLQQNQRSLAKKTPTDEEKRSLRRDTQDLRKGIDEYLKNLDDALAERSLFDVEREWKRELERQRRQLQKLVKELDRQLQEAGDSGMVSLPELDALLDDFENEAGAMEERVGKPARRIVEVAKILERANLFLRLTEEQVRLAKLARRFEEKKETLTRLEQMELQEIAAAERRIRDALKGMLEELPDLVAKLPEGEDFDDFRESVTDFLQKIKDAEIAEDLDKAAGKFTELKGDEGVPPAKSAADKMLKIIAEMTENGAMQGGGAGGDGGPGRLVFTRIPGMGQSLQQVLDAMLGGGQGGSGSGSMGSYGQDVGLYGPDMQLARLPQSGMDRPMESGGSPDANTSKTDAADPGLPQPHIAGRVRPQYQARFPLRYRELVGEYFRAVAESATE